MPFTPLHLGPALFFGLIMRLNLPVILIASVCLDIEPLAVILLKLKLPIHGLLHTLVGASVAAVFISVLARDWHKSTISAFLGTYLHIAFDSPLYPEMKPLYPLIQSNPLYGILPAEYVYGISIVMLAAGFGIYGYRVCRL